MLHVVFGLARTWGYLGGGEQEFLRMMEKGINLEARHLCLESSDVICSIVIAIALTMGNTVSPIQMRPETGEEKEERRVSGKKQSWSLFRGLWRWDKRREGGKWRCR